MIGLSLLPLTAKSLAKWALGRPRHGVASMLHDLCGATRFDSLACFVTLIGFSVLAVSIWVLTVQLVALAVDVRISWLTLGMIVVLVELVRLLPLSVQGIGVRESAYAYLFGMAGQSSEAGFVIGTVSYLALSLSILLAGAVGFGCFIATRQPHRS